MARTKRKEGMGLRLMSDYSITMPDGSRGEIRKERGQFYLRLPNSVTIRPTIRRVPKKKRGRIA